MSLRLTIIFIRLFSRTSLEYAFSLHYSMFKTSNHASFFYRLTSVASYPAGNRSCPFAKIATIRRSEISNQLHLLISDTAIFGYLLDVNYHLTGKRSELSGACLRFFAFGSRQIAHHIYHYSNTCFFCCQVFHKLISGSETILFHQTARADSCLSALGIPCLALLPRFRSSPVDLGEP